MRQVNKSFGLVPDHGFDELREVWRTHAIGQVIARHGEESVCRLLLERLERHLALSVAVIADGYVVERANELSTSQIGSRRWLAWAKSDRLLGRAGGGCEPELLRCKR